LDVAIDVDPVYDQEDRDQGHDDDHWESLQGDSASSITSHEEHGEDATEKTTTYVTSSVPEMHATESKASAEIGSMKSKNNTMKGTVIIMVLCITNVTRKGHRKRDTSQEASRHIP
jgi:hypothetical protein